MDRGQTDETGAERRRKLFLSFAVACALALPPEASGQALRFTNGTALAGIATDGPAQGVAVIDVDRDGYDDIFFAGAGGASALFMNNADGTFRDVTSASGLEVPGNAVAPVWTDVNNDGAPDLFVGIRSGSDPNKLFMNSGEGVFEDVISASGVDPAARIGSATFGDYDQDGFPDLFLATRGAGDRLYRNLGDATFEEVTQAAGVAGEVGTVAMQATWVDFDRDGDLDLFAVHDGIDLNRLYRNDGVLPFTEIAAQANIDQVGSGNGMGVAWFDSDLDGYDDVYVTRIGIGSLYRNRGDGTFEDIATEVGAEKNGLTWGVVAADFDNDGDDDLFMVNTHSYDGVSETWLYRNEAGQFANVARSASAAYKLDSFGVATGDFNADGLIDIVITSTAGDNRLLLNATQNPGAWVSVELRDDASTGLSFGAAVRIVAGDREQRKSLFGAQGYCSQSAGRVQFGIGDASVVDTLEVLWPGGGAEVYTDLDPNKSYILTHGETTVRGEETEPARFDLSVDLYPNPFQSWITVEFDLEEGEEIELDVFDIVGRHVARLASGRHAAGSHSIIWTGRYDSGVAAPSGVYLIRLTAGGQRLTATAIHSD